MTRELSRTQIIEAIRKIAALDRTPPGQKRFATLTKTRITAWHGVFWARWSEALREAGFEPNTVVARYSDEELLESYAQLALKLGRIPIAAEMDIERARGTDIPDWCTLTRRFGLRQGVMRRLKAHCESRPHLAPVAALCATYVRKNPMAPGAPRGRKRELGESKSPERGPGFVYLVKCAEKYKIGRTDCIKRRCRELAQSIPFPVELIHSARVRDCRAMERFWHRRFRSKNVGGEWFELDDADVAVFKAESRPARSRRRPPHSPRPSRAPLSPHPC